VMMIVMTIVIMMVMMIVMTIVMTIVIIKVMMMKVMVMITALTNVALTEKKAGVMKTVWIAQMAGIMKVVIKSYANLAHLVKNVTLKDKTITGLT